MTLYEQALTTGDMEGDMALLFAYGLWLRGGGDPDSFERLTPTDVQILISTEVGLRKMSATFNADAYARLFTMED